MSLAAGARLGPYEIVALLGAGGMGEVYRARDTRLDRTVAVKVLHPHLAEDADRRARFEKEARAVSGLSHPHVCALFDVGTADGVAFLVMEYLEGESLAERLLRGPLPLDQVLVVGQQVADALDAAHRRGVVHRYLKPSNVMLTRAGAKLLDFGLAKSVDRGPAASADADVDVETRSRHLTSPGVVLGTFQYMAPEQLDAREADARTDVFALGTLLHEMATGRKAFDGRSQASLIAAIMERDPPPPSSLQPLAPAGFDHLVRRCLAKDPEERWQSARDVRFALESIAGGPTHTGDVRPPPSRRAAALAALVAAVATGLVLGAIAGARLARPTATPQVAVRSALLAPAGAELGPFAQVALSPDGSQLAFVAARDRRPTLWIRRLDAPEARALPGTEGAAFPFWSPDGRSIAFFAQGALNRIDVAGGAVRRICEAPTGRGGTWLTDGTILFTPTAIAEGLHRVAAGGGEASTFTQLDGSRHEISHRWPALLPDGRHFVYYAMAAGRDRGLYLGSLDGAPPRLLVPQAASNAVYAAGHLLFVTDGDLIARPFDLRNLAFAGEPAALAERVAYNQPFRWADFSAAADVVAYRPETQRMSRLIWVDRSGHETGQVAAEEAYYQRPALSRDGRRLAVVRLDARTQDGDLWVHETDRPGGVRLTTGSEVFSPAWSPDGTRLAYTSTRSGVGNLYQRDLAGAETVLLQSEDFKLPNDWSPDSRWLLFQGQAQRTSWDLWILPLDGHGKERPFVQTPGLDGSGQFSPTGRTVAYVSSESGRQEVYLRDFPGPSAVQRVSSEGGQGVQWRGDGRELFYFTLDGTLTSVDVTEGPPRQVGMARPLFKSDVTQFGIGAVNYDVAPDGQRFLLASPTGDPAPAVVMLVAHWPTLPPPPPDP